MEQLLTIESAARVLSISPRTLRKWVYERRVSIRKVGRAVRIATSEVERIAEAGKRERVTL